MIELLTVISIAAIMISLLAPALSSAKLTAKDAVCASNERQIHMLVFLYAHDHDQYYPTITWWQEYNQLALFSNYVSKLDFFRCPNSNSDVIKLPDNSFIYPTPINGQTAWTEYKINDAASGPPDTGLVGFRLGDQRRPNMTVLVIDAEDGAPRHRGRSNVCFQDGHVQVMKMAQYDGNAAEPGSTTTWPRGWWAWGIYSY
ncbi:MAG: prepilin-type N-terminal cleavage/methylation domain-containing protein [Verrucomicrobiae bacterium]|nr:prepilin-type N-terminal cleavage/methylation domain-containing protein [Verrucomicrobiae bacterium]